MKRKLNLLVFPIVLATLASCGSIQPTMDNNVYMMRSPVLPIGEDLVDETSYSTYKYRAETGNPASDYYNSGNNTALSSGTTRQNLAFNGRFLSWERFNPYFGMHRDGHYIGGGLYGFSNFYPTGVYGSLNSSLGNYYGVYPIYGYNFCNYGSGGVYNNWNNGIQSSGSNNSINNTNLFHPIAPARISAPRATSGGYYSGNNKGGGIKTKSIGNSGGSALSRSNAVVSNSNQYSNNAYVSRNSTPTYTRSGTNAPSRSVNSTYSGSNRSVSTTRSTTNRSVSTTRPTSGVRVNSGSNSAGSQRSSSGVSTSGSTPSGSSSRSGGRGL